tara:strand:- start:326 stop:538 length:213 start_codon:yes stop_codon:yes gene_type:complete
VGIIPIYCRGSRNSIADLRIKIIGGILRIIVVILITRANEKAQEEPYKQIKISHGCSFIVSSKNTLKGHQ